MRLMRFYLSYGMLNFGLWLMPKGAAKTELIEILTKWTAHVVAEVAEAKANASQNSVNHLGHSAMDVVSNDAKMNNVACRYCGRDRHYPCMNTRDMEDFAIDGDPVCYTTLEAHGGGEKGMQYVTLNRDSVAAERRKKG